MIKHAEILWVGADNPTNLGMGGNNLDTVVSDASSSLNMAESLWDRFLGDVSITVIFSSESFWGQQFPWTN